MPEKKKTPSTKKAKATSTAKKSTSVAKKKTTTKAKKPAAAKKTTPAKAKVSVTPEKNVSKKKVSATTFKPKVSQTNNKDQSPNFWLGLAVVFLFAIVLGGLLQMLAADDTPVRPMVEQRGVLSVSDLTGSLLAQLTNGQQLIVHGGRTWIPVEGEPVELVVLNDETCGQPCDPTGTLESLRKGVTPALLIRTLDITSEEGQQMIKDFDIKGIPAFAFGEGVDKFQRNGEFFLEKAADVLTEKDGKYFLDPTATGIKFGKFIVAPEFELDKEPELGEGPVKVVEFTDFQCPFCKRFHDQNKDLITELVEDGSITYVVKDFPLGFHPEARTMHLAANCVYLKHGIKRYMNFKSQVFDNQKEWSGAAGKEVSLAQKYAQNVGASVDVAACVEDAEMGAELLADMEEGSRYGVSGTPSVFVGTQVLPGAVGPERLRATVEAELKK